MDSAWIIAIVSISGVLGILLGAALNHYFSERRAKADVRRAYKKSRISPLVEFVTDVTRLVFQLENTQDKQEMKTIAGQLEEAIKSRGPEQSAIIYGIDERLNDQMLNFLKSTTDYTGAWLDKIQGKDTGRSYEMMLKLMTEVTLLVSLCYHILEEH